jgi:hypothetical protein
LDKGRASAFTPRHSHAVGIPHRLRGRRRLAATGANGFLDRFRDEVEGADVMAGPGEVRRHSAAHVAKPDKCNTRH